LFKGDYTGVFTTMVKTVAAYIHRLVKILSWVANGALGLMILFVVSNIFTRFFFNKPLSGSIELVELVAVVVVFCSLSYTESRRGHVHVELVVSRFSVRVQAILASIMYFLSTAFFLTMGWRGAVLGWTYVVPRIRETFVLSIPIAPFVFVIAFGSLVLALESLIHVFYPLGDEEIGGVN